MIVETVPAGKLLSGPRNDRTPMFKLEDFIPHLLHRATAQIAHSFHFRAKEYGVTIEKWRVLASLLREDGQSMSGLAASTSIEISALSHLLKRMEGEATIQRSRDPADGRVIRLRLSAKGREIAERILPLTAYYEDAALRGFSHEEAATLRALLKRVDANLRDLPTPRSRDAAPMSQAGDFLKPSRN